MFRNIQVQFEPIGEWTGERTKCHRRSQFKASLDDTYRKLEYELAHLGCKRLVIQVDAVDYAFRVDGMLRRDARLRSPAVILAFDSKHGPQSYPCDTFGDWASNMRAIALALEALRAVDRYGVTKRGEQYRGWQALPAPNGDNWTKTEAIEFLRVLLGVEFEPGKIGGIDEALRNAEFKTHPDRGGNPDDFKKVQRARELLTA